jgi:tripartite-type tricarboxylate transporter receptor subunit TctC
MECVMRRLVCAAALVASLIFCAEASAETYPSRPITLIVPFGAGGPTDVIARVLAQRMGKSLGQTIVVENVTGAAGTIAVNKAVHSPPDGYTLSIGHYGTHAVNALVYSLPFDVVKDLEPVALIARSPYLIVEGSEIPAADIKGLVTWLKAHPDKTLASTNGPGSAGQLLGIKFQRLTGLQFRFIPYRGGDAASMQDVLAGRLPMKFAQPADALPLVRSGRIKALAVTANAPLAAAPEIPTTDKEGLSGFHVSVWHGLWVPKGTPPAIVAKLNAAVRTALAAPEIRTRLANLGQDIPLADQQTPQALRAQQQAEIEEWRPIVEEEHIRADASH